MKKLIFKCIVVVVIAIGVSNYGLYLTTGQVPSMSSFIPSFSVSTPSIDQLTPITSQKDTVYKWVDANGLTQYSSEPPPAQINAEVLKMDPNTNIIKSLEVEEEIEEAPKIQTPNMAAPTGNIYNPENVKKLMDDAKNVQKMLDERYQKQQEALDDL